MNERDDVAIGTGNESELDVDMIESIQEDLRQQLFGQREEISRNLNGSTNEGDLNVIPAHSREPRSKRTMGDNIQSVNKKVAVEKYTSQNNNSQIGSSQPFTQDQSNSNDPDKGKTDKNLSLYNRYGKGPFTVFVESVDQNIGRIHHMKLWKIIKDACIIGIKQIKPKGRNRIELVMDKYYQANELAQSKRLETFNLKCYIPFSKTQTKGIAFGVEPTISDDELTTEAKVCNKNVAKVQRIYKYRNNSTEEKTPTDRVIIITFSSNELPEFLYLYYLRIRVRKYVSRLIQCFNCMKFHHVSSECRGKLTCTNCGKNDHNKDNCLISDANLVCCNCQGKHAPTDKNCIARKEQMEIKYLAVQKNLSIREATATLCNRNNSPIGSHPTYIKDSLILDEKTDKAFWMRTSEQGVIRMPRLLLTKTKQDIQVQKKHLL